MMNSVNIALSHRLEWRHGAWRTHRGQCPSSHSYWPMK